MKKTQTSKSLMRRVLFLEVTGFFSLAITLAVITMLVSMNLVDMKSLVLPGAGLLLVFAFIILTIRYARRDLHLIHELHAKPIYKWGRYFVYLLAAVMVIYPVYMVIADKDFFSSIGEIIVAELLLVLGIFTIYYTFILGYLIQNEHLRHDGVTFTDLFTVVIFPIALVAGSVWMLLSEEAITVEKGEADYTIAASKIIAEYEASDSLANSKYAGKIVQFGGTVGEISGDLAVLMKLNVGVESATANCGFDKSMKATLAKVQTGDSVVVKCSCSGYSKPEGEMDLLSEKSLDMVRCNLEQHVARK